jgi:hypothetical protein
MSSAGRERGKEIRKRPTGSPKRQRDAKKILKKREQTQRFVENTGVSGFLSEKQTQNKPKTNSILSAKSAKNREQGTVERREVAGRRGREW